VPDEAARTWPDGLFAFVVGNDDKVQQRAVSVSQESDIGAVVAKGCRLAKKSSSPVNMA